MTPLASHSSDAWTPLSPPAPSRPLAVSEPPAPSTPLAISEPPAPSTPLAISEPPAPSAPPRRRGTILVFVLGTLTLLLLIGVGLLATVRGERARWQRLRSAQIEPQLLDQVVQTVRERLRSDLWSPDKLANGTTRTPEYLDDHLAKLGGYDTAAESNEPYDAPGPADRWLASTLPFVVRDPTTGAVVAVPTGTAGGEQTIAWPRVSYLGTDIVASDIQRLKAVPASEQTQFWWQNSSRDGNPFGTTPPIGVVYGDDLGASGVGPYQAGRGSLNAFGEAAGGTLIEGLPVLLTPPTYGSVSFPPGAWRHTVNGSTNFVNLPGTTTDITIAGARRLWDLGINRPTTAIGQPTPAFPYFDTNMDGIVDLYDADGDGIPDSPLSFAMPYPGRDPNDPSRVYAAIRIIDNASMVNVNTASPLDAPEIVNRLTFDEVDRSAATPPNAYPPQDSQRRGRYPSSALLNAVALGNDNSTGRSSGVTQRLYTGQGTPFMIPAGLYAPGFATRYYGRTFLIGGRNPNGPQYEPYGIPDEISLRSRFSLPPPEMAAFNKATNSLNDYSTLDSALRWTLLWDTNWNNPPTFPPNYTAGNSRRGRWSTNTITTPASPTVLPPLEAVRGGSVFTELNQVSGFKGWKTLVTDDAPWGIRRPMLTTISYGSSRQTITYSPPSPALQALAFDDGLARYPLPPITAADMREKVSLNPIFRDPATGFITEPDPTRPVLEQMKARYISLLAHAIYSADVQLGWNQKNQVPNTAPSEREDVAWQLAVNIVDCLDRDDTPTVLVDVAGVPKYVGSEVQPFFTKVYVHLVWDYNKPGTTKFDGSDYAVELINPFRRTPSVPVGGMNVSNFFIKVTPGSDVTLVGTMPWYDYPAADGGTLAAGLNGPGRLVVRSNGGIPVTVTPSHGSSQPQDNSTLKLSREDENVPNDFYPEIKLVRRLTLAGGATADWIVDRVDIREAMGPPPGGGEDYPPSYAGNEMNADDLDFSLQRDDATGVGAMNWQFTIDWYRRERTTTGQTDYPRLGQSYAAGAGAQFTTYGKLPFPGSPWVIRNTGFVGTSSNDILGGNQGFDSVGDLCRILAVGTRNPAAPKPITQIIRENGNTDLTKGIAIGRIDFTNENQTAIGGGTPQAAANAARLFEVLTPDALSYDGIDNDGLDRAGQFSSTLPSNLRNEMDGAMDSPADYTEAQRCHYRVAGMINVNTAPATVLRAAPFMDNFNALLASEQWDFAAAIISERERRAVPSKYTTLGIAPAGNSNDPTFKTLGDVLNAGKLAINGPGPFSLRRFGNQGVDLPSHDNNTNGWSPDFDGKVLPVNGKVDDNATIIGDVRERDLMLSRWGGILTTRSDVYTVYIALVDENGRFLRRTQFTLDRSVCASEDTDPVSRRPVLPEVLGRVDTDYADDLR